MRIGTIALQDDGPHRSCKDVAANVGTTDVRAAVERVYREHRERLWRSLMAVTGDRDTADDVLAETFAQALGRGAAIHRLDAWVWRTAFRIAAGEMKRRRRTGRALEARAEYIPEPIDHIIKALARLSPNQRLAVVLHDYADRPTDEVAQTMGITRATVHVHLSQGRRKLRQMLGEDDA